MDFDIDNCKFVGFNLLNERTKATLKEKGEKKVSSYIKYQKQQWKHAINKLHSERRLLPIRETKTQKNK